MKLYYILIYINLFINLNNSLLYNNMVNLNIFIRKPLQNTIINFIKINNVNNMKIKNTSNYLLLKYYDDFNNPLKKNNKKLYNLKNISSYFEEELNEDINFADSKNKNNKIYELIKYNNKPIIIINEKKNNKYNMKNIYLINNKTNYIYKYMIYEKNNLKKYKIDINAIEINKKETLWITNIYYNSLLEYYLNIRIDTLNNWLVYILNNNNKNFYYKKYLLLNYFT
jgi:hypothetical protein